MSQHESVGKWKVNKFETISPGGKTVHYQI